METPKNLIFSKFLGKEVENSVENVMFSVLIFNCTDILHIVKFSGVLGNLKAWFFD